MAFIRIPGNKGLTVREDVALCSTIGQVALRDRVGAVVLKSSGKSVYPSTC